MRIGLGAALFMSVMAFNAFSQVSFPDTIYVPVTFYDFHSDKSNPEFECAHTSGVRTGMVASQLGTNDKPALGPQPYINYGIAKWFSSWKAGDFKIPNYQINGGEYDATVTWQGDKTVDYDTAFINKTIIDTLPFNHTGNGMYTFSRRGPNHGEEQFLWIDNRGFGNENNNHNFSFSMELHHTFTYMPGMTFKFNGDDDVWVFINKKLALDLGGLHSATDGDFALDAIATQFGLSVGSAYDLDVFYVERHTDASTICITTDLIGPPSDLLLYGQSGTPNTGTNKPLKALDTVVAGQPFNIYGHVFDTTGAWVQKYDSLISWKLVNNTGNGSLSTAKGSTNSFTATDAFTKITVEAEFENPLYPGTVSKTTITLYVQPGAAHHLDILEDSTVTSLINDVNVGEIVLDEGRESDQVFAIVRDQYGNYVRRATNAAWSSRDRNVVTVTPDATKKWIGTVEKMATGETMVLVSETGLLADSVRVRAQMGVSLSFAITRDNNGNGYLDAIELHFDTLLSSAQASYNLSGFIVKHNDKTYTVTGLAGKSGAADSVFILTLKEDNSGPLQTDWELKVTGELPLLKNGSAVESARWANVATRDGAGPVIDRAIYYPGKGLNGSDTLRVLLSEPVKASTLLNSTPTTTFLYYSKEFGQTAEPLKGSDLSSAKADLMIKEVLIVTDPASTFRIIPFDDSLQLVDAAFDAAGNKTPGADKARKARIESGGENDITLTVVTNPFSTERDVLTPELRNYVLKNYGDIIPNNRFGGIITLNTDKPLDQQSDGFYGSATVYDAVGNLVVEDLHLLQSRSSRGYAVFWDGTNRNGRKVGNGVYLLAVKVKDVDGKSYVQKAKVGVRQ
jgi:fibro-slime domain-containing protein